MKYIMFFILLTSSILMAQQFDGLITKIIVIDGCQYIAILERDGDYIIPGDEGWRRPHYKISSFTHKGNCTNSIHKYNSKEEFSFVHPIYIAPSPPERTVPYIKMFDSSPGLTTNYISENYRDMKKSATNFAMNKYKVQSYSNKGKK